MELEQRTNSSGCISGEFARRPVERRAYLTVGASLRS